MEDNVDTEVLFVFLKIWHPPTHPPRPCSLFLFSLSSAKLAGLCMTGCYLEVTSNLYSM